MLDPEIGFRTRPVWFVALAALVVGQGALALQLFGNGTFAAIHDDRPILNGRHPLHLYHGMLGAETFRETRAVTCYDPHFQAGYPKTPVFDSGSRPAELFVFTFGTRTPAAAYKLGLFLVCAVVPLVFASAGRGLGLSAPVACLAGAGGCFIWWSPAVRGLLEAGHVDGLILGLAWIAFCGGLARYASDPGLTGWFLMALASLIGWYVHPVGWLGVLPMVAVYYLVSAPRHGLAWHLGLLAVLAVGVVPNLWWLADWSRFWWLRQPVPGDSEGVPALLQLLGQFSDYRDIFGPGPFGIALLVLVIPGLFLLARHGRSGSVWLTLAAGLSAVVAARLGQTWMAARTAESVGVALPALAVLPASYALGYGLQRFRAGGVLLGAAAALPALAAWFGVGSLGLAIEPLQLGPTPALQQLLDAIHQKTTREARLLIEDDGTSLAEWNWPALLGLPGDRYCIGGLDPEANIEHLACGMKAGKLQGRAWAEWTPADREAYCHRYNIGWVLCRTPESAQWWASDPHAKVIGRYFAGTDCVLFEWNRPQTFVLSGRATISQMDRERIVLTDVTPDETGWVRLSLHYQQELLVAPLNVTPAPDPDSSDPIPFLKLQLPGPVSRITISWPHP